MILATTWDRLLFVVVLYLLAAVYTALILSATGSL